MDRWVFFVLMTAMIFYCTMWHFQQHRDGRFKGFRRLGEFLVGHQVITDRAKNPIRFAIAKWVLGALLVGFWIGWLALFRIMIQGE